MDYRIRKACMNDLAAILRIYEYARQFMIRHDNPGQWGNGYPSAQLLTEDIVRKKLYLLTDAAEIRGVFYFAVEEDPTYRVIYDGAWNSEAVYGVIHRIAGNGSRGILAGAVAFALEQVNYLRIDTHEDNWVMQKALQKQGFRRCGRIRLTNGDERIAYDRFTAGSGTE